MHAGERAWGSTAARALTILACFNKIQHTLTCEKWLGRTKKTHRGTAVQWQRHTYTRTICLQFVQGGNEEKKTTTNKKNTLKAAVHGAESINYFPLTRHCFSYSHCGGVRPSAIEVKFARIPSSRKLPQKDPLPLKTLLLLQWKQSMQRARLAGHPDLLSFARRCMNSPHPPTEKKTGNTTCQLRTYEVADDITLVEDDGRDKNKSTGRGKKKAPRREI